MKRLIVNPGIGACTVAHTAGEFKVAVLTLIRTFAHYW